MKTLTKSFVPFEVKAETVDEEARTFRGLASTWDEDLGGDRIVKGAFARTLDAWRGSKGKKPVFLIDQHNYGTIRSVLGKMIEAEETDAGLETVTRVIDGPDGDEALRRVKGGYITGLSIGYSAVKWEIEKVEGGQEWESIRILKELKLFEYSLVIWPMNEGSLIDTASVKALLRAARDGDTHLNDEQKAQLRANLEAARNDIDALLRVEDAPEGLAAERQQALQQRLLALKLRRLATPR
jgi:uncharacterized protein